MPVCRYAASGPANSVEGSLAASLRQDEPGQVAIDVAIPMSRNSPSQEGMIDMRTISTRLRGQATMVRVVAT